MVMVLLLWQVGLIANIKLHFYKDLLSLLFTFSSDKKVVLGLLIFAEYKVQLLFGTNDKK